MTRRQKLDFILGRPCVLAVVALVAVGVPLAGAATVQKDHIRVSFDGVVTPRALPRVGSAPIRVAVDAKIAPARGADPPQLRRLTIAINSDGRLDPRGLPVCRLGAIQPSTTANALAACGSSLVGEGRFSAQVLLAEQAPFPSDGKVVAFNGSFDGRPAILAHVYGTKPVPSSFTLPFVITKSTGAFGTLLSASLPQITGNSGYITGLRLTIGRSFRSGGRTHSYLSASCPAPAGFPGAVFPLAKASFGFAGGRHLASIATRECRVRG